MSEAGIGSISKSGKLLLKIPASAKISLSAEARAPRSDAEALGVQVAEDLLNQGANDILKAVYGEAGHE